MLRNKLNKRGTRALTSYGYNNFVKSKRSQITIFIIVAILIVTAIILLFWLYNRTLPIAQQPASENPKAFLESCINQHVETAVDKLFENSGYLKQPNLTKTFNGEKITYLCYTKDNYARCIVQEPVFIEHLNDEIYNSIKSGVTNCIASLETDLREEGASVNSEPGMSFLVNLIPGAVEVVVNKKITISKTGETRRFDEFKANYNTPLYDMFIIIQEITRQESMYCNAERENIMRMNSWVEIIKFQTGDDNRIYTVRDTRTEKEIKFAIRGCVLNTPS